MGNALVMVAQSTPVEPVSRLQHEQKNYMEPCNPLKSIRSTKPLVLISFINMVFTATIVGQGRMKEKYHEIKSDPFLSLCFGSWVISGYLQRHSWQGSGD